jgi:hypothetical protein
MSFGGGGPVVTLSNATITLDGSRVTGDYSSSIGSPGTFIVAKTSTTSSFPNETITGDNGSTLNFASASSGGQTTILEAPTSGATIPPNFTLIGGYYHVITTVSGGGPFTFCANYPGTAGTNDIVSGILETNLQISHNHSGTWNDQPRATGSSASLNRVCATVPNLSEFAIVGESCADTDLDGVCNPADNCPAASNVAQTNSDADTHGDACDNCPTTSNENQANVDADPAGDACEPAHCLAVPNWWTSPGAATDPDCDGFATADETRLATNPNDPCADTAASGDENPDDKWPADFNDNQFVNTLDLVVYATALNTSVGHPQFVARADLNGNDAINTLDLVPYVFMLNRSCVPPP